MEFTVDRLGMRGCFEFIARSAHSGELPFANLSVGLKDRAPEAT